MISFFIGGYTVVVADPVVLEGMLELEKKSITSRFSGADAAVSWILKKKNLPDILYFALVSNVRFSSVNCTSHTQRSIVMQYFQKYTKSTSINLA